MFNENIIFVIQTKNFKLLGDKNTNFSGYLTSALEEDLSRLRCLSVAALLASAAGNRSWGTRSRAETSAQGPEIFLLESRYFCGRMLKYYCSIRFFVWLWSDFAPLSIVAQSAGGGIEVFENQR